jgi:hypothetical protein
MRTILLAGVAAILSTSAFAETTVIRRSGSDTVVDRTESVGTVDRKTVTRTEDADGCGSTTVHKEDGMGNSKTVKKEGC